VSVGATVAVSVKVGVSVGVAVTVSVSPGVKVASVASCKTTPPTIKLAGDFARVDVADINTRASKTNKSTKFFLNDVFNVHHLLFGMFKFFPEIIPLIRMADG
jgi:hypothetical protein